MRRAYTRRATLVALGSVAVAGCSTSDDSFWDDPPAFDDTGLESVTDRPLPDRPEPIPTTITAEKNHDIAARVDGLLEPIPEPLTAEIVPNGKIREALVTERGRARESLDRMRTASATLPAATAGADACEHAAAAAGIWAAIHTVRSPQEVTLSRAEVEDQIGRLQSQLPDLATSPQEGAVVYGAVGWWLDSARRSTLVGDTAVEDRPDPLRVGRATGSYERIRTEVDVGDHLRGRYVDGLDAPREIGDDLTTAVSELAPRTKERLLALHGGETERLHRPPRAEDVLTREVPHDHPGRRLLARKAGTYRGDRPYHPIAWPEYDSDFPALTVRSTHRAFGILDAVESLGERIDDGDDLSPPDAAAVREARDGAIDSVARLGESDSPLERWVAWELGAAFDEPDGLASSGAGPREVARAFGEYVWIRTVVDEIPPVTGEVSRVLGE